jgi:hypothetical protein
LVKKSTIFALEAHDKALRDQLRAAEEEIAAKTNAIYKSERAFTDKIADLTNLGDKIDKYSSLAELQKRGEIIALRVKLEAIKAPDEILLYVKGSHGVQPGNEHEGVDVRANVSISPDD